MSDVGIRKKRLETDAWERHRQVIERLYLDEGQALEQVMAYMKEKHNFEATEQAYKKKLRRWKISKNIPAPAMEYMLLQAEQRSEQGKETLFYWHDRPVDPEKIERSKQRMNREKRDNPEKQIVVPPPGSFDPSLSQVRLLTGSQAVLRLIRIDTPPLVSNSQMPQQALPLRLEIPQSNNFIQNDNIPPIPSFTFTSFEPMLVDPTPASAKSNLSFFPDNNQPATLQFANSPTLSSAHTSDPDIDAMFDTDFDFEQLRAKLQMMGSSNDVQRALMRGNKLLKAGSALLPKTNLESMDVSRMQNQEALAQYRSVLEQMNPGADSIAIADSLRHISQIQANSSLPDLDPEASLAERERLLAGFHFLFGLNSPIYLRQVIDFCDKGRSADPIILNNHVSMFKQAVYKMLDGGFQLDKTESILHTANTYFLKNLLSISELDVIFSRIIAHQAPQAWWKDCENLRFVARVFLLRQMYTKAEPYLVTIMEVACNHIAQGDFFQQDQYACFMFETLSAHIWTGNPEYESLLMMLEEGLRNLRHPSQFDCLELTCWILLAITYTNFLRPPEKIMQMLNDANLSTRQDRPKQVSWHFIDGINSALESLAKRLRDYDYEDFSTYVFNLAQSIAVRWAMPKLYAGS